MDLGKKIRLIRKAQKRTQEEISDRCGFTKSLLSKIENGQTVPAVATLTKIAKALGVKVSDLLDPQPENGTIFTPAVQHQNADKWIATNHGYSFFAFAPGMSGKPMQPYLFRARRGDLKGKHFSHEGDEFIYMLEGSMKYRIGSVEYLMRPGDSVYFQALQEHMLTPVTDEVKYLAVFTEPMA